MRWTRRPRRPTPSRRRPPRPADADARAEPDLRGEPDARGDAPHGHAGPAHLDQEPQGAQYKVGQTLKISFTCTDSSGVARYKATFGRVGHKARTVKKGTKVHLSRAGTYVLRITATDRKGNTTSTVVRLRVTRR